MSDRSPEFRSAARRLRHFGLFLPLAALAVAIFGLIRLGRQFPAAAASPSLLVPFLLPVLALALEAGALVALSTAQLWAVLETASTFRERCRQTLPLLAFMALVLAGAELVPRGTERPGAFANDLIATARSSCEGNAKVPVPLLGLNVSCAQPQRIEGPMPGVRAVQVAMTELVFSDDLRGVDIVGLDLTAARALRVHLVAGRARIAGLAPWSRSPRLTPLARFVMLAALGALLWLATNLAWRASPPSPDAPATPRRWQLGLASLLFATPGAAAAARVITLDQERAEPAAYATAALLALVGLGLVLLLGRAAPRIFRSFSGF